MKLWYLLRGFSIIAEGDAITPHSKLHTSHSILEDFMSDETKVTQEYGGSQIQVLEGLEAVRKRPLSDILHVGQHQSVGVQLFLPEAVDFQTVAVVEQ